CLNQQTKINTSLYGYSRLENSIALMEKFLLVNISGTHCQVARSAHLHVIFFITAEFSMTFSIISSYFSVIFFSSFWTNSVRRQVFHCNHSIFILCFAALLGNYRPCGL
ncbi:hypothetical protein L9F63_008530, partial [Diploptera punctata]